VESQLERSILERKDRDELHRIASAMGGKPGSRARKAEIVDLILELAGVDEAPTETKPKKKPAKKAASKVGDANSNGDRSAESKGDTALDDSSATDEGSASSEADPSDAGDPRAGDDESASPMTDGDDGDDRSASGVGSDRSGDHQVGEAEAGGKRRRRRGRNRDREPQGQGGDEQWQGEAVEVNGLLDLRDEGYGFLRLKSYLPSKEDVYVSVKQVRQFGLRKGDHIKGASRPAGRSEKNPALLRIDEVNGATPELGQARPRFEDLTPVHPDEWLQLERTHEPSAITPRMIDLVAPVGKGQRGLIVAPPNASRTSVMMEIASSIETNYPEVHLMILLIDERPEEVTAMRRHVQGEVVASTFDRPADEHTMVTELAIERAKRLVEEGKDVVILFDGITRLARAYNAAIPATGRSTSGGIETGALYPPKKFFGAARNLEDGGSLTILATAMVATGSRMDEVIFEEFGGTWNMELRLDRHAAERRMYPAIDVVASSTRHEELLLEPGALEQLRKLRQALQALSADDQRPCAGLEMLIDRLPGFDTNDRFLAETAK